MKLKMAAGIAVFGGALTAGSATLYVSAFGK